MKWSIAGALVLGAVGVLAVPKPAEALPVQRLEITYYSNAAMTHEVGWHNRTHCGGGSTPLVGQTSQFSSRMWTSCSSDLVSKSGCYSHANKISCPATFCQQVPEFC